MWDCPSCTLKNQPNALLCILCSATRPSPTLNYPYLNSPELNSTTHTNASPMIETPNNKSRNRKKVWTKVSSKSSYLQFEYNHHNNNNNNNNNNRNVCNDNTNHINNNNNGMEEYNYHFDFDANRKNSIQQINKQIKLIPSPHMNHERRRSKKYNKYSITDIFACNSSFMLDNKYNNNDICNLILNNSTQTQTKLKFLKSIWPHILRVTTRVLKGSKFRCPICLDENIYVGRITICGHCFCGMCLIHHLFITQKLYITEIKNDDENYNFTDLFGHCPLCNEYVSFEECRPLTVIRCNDYKVNDLIDIVLIERKKGEQPEFTSYYKHNLNISTFRKFESENNEIEKCDYELNQIENDIKSSDPIYEKPFLYLLSIQIKQYKKYILQQRQECNDNLYNENKENIPKQQQQQQQKYRKKKYVYQSIDGQLIFLHPHNYNMLKHEVNYNFNNLASYLSQCKILQIDTFCQSYDLRRKYPFLAFIPNDISFNFIEVDLSNIISKNTLKYFEKQSFDRKQHRIEQEKLIKEEKKEKELVEEERIKLQKQKYAPKPQINLNDFSEFPLLSTTPTPLKDNSSSNSDNDKLSDNDKKQIIKSPLQRSWSQITINKKVLSMESMKQSSQCVITNSNTNTNSNKKKRRRGRNKKKNKNKDNQ